jgi:hypothetical protein
MDLSVIALYGQHQRRKSYLNVRFITGRDNVWDDECGVVVESETLWLVYDTKQLMHVQLNAN